MTMLIATVIIVAMVYGLIKKYETRTLLSKINFWTAEQSGAQKKEKAC